METREQMQNPAWHCVPCNLGFNDRAMFIRHRATVSHVHYTESTGHYCVSCKPAKRLVNRERWEQHRYMIHGIGSATQGAGAISEQNAIRTEIEIWPCPYCPVYARRFKDIFLLGDHMNTVHSKERILDNVYGSLGTIVVCNYCEEDIPMSIELGGLHIEIHRRNFVGTEPPNRPPIERNPSAMDVAHTVAQQDSSAAVGFSHQFQRPIAQPPMGTFGQTSHSHQIASDNTNNLPSTPSSGTFGLPSISAVPGASRIGDVSPSVDTSAQSAESPQVADDSSTAPSAAYYFY